MISTKHTNEVEVAQGRASIYAFVSNALQYPSERILEDLFDEQRWLAWKDQLGHHYPELSESLDALVQFDPKNQSLTEPYIDLFGHAVRGTCPPYEIEYGRAEVIQQASELADIKGYYDAFGLQIVEQAHERLDHVCIECEFMSALCSKLAYALENKNDEAQQVLVDAQGSFLEQHLARWIVAFAVRLQDANPHGFYGALGKLICEFMRTECTAFDIPCGPQFLELRPPDPENDTTIQCGVEESCPGAVGDSSQDFVQLGIDDAH